MKVRHRTVRKPSIWCVLPLPVKTQICLSFQQMRPESLLSIQKRFKSLGVQESKTMVLIILKCGCPTDLSHRYAQKTHCLFCYGASFSFNVITLLKSGVA